MSAWLQAHSYVIAAVFIGWVSLVCLAWLARRASEDPRRTLMSYLLLWPLIFEAERDAKRKTRLLFVVGGAAIALLLVVGGIVMFPRR